MAALDGGMAESPLGVSARRVKLHDGLTVYKCIAGGSSATVAGYNEYCSCLAVNSGGGGSGACSLEKLEWRGLYTQFKREHGEVPAAAS